MVRLVLRLETVINLEMSRINLEMLSLGDCKD